MDGFLLRLEFVELALQYLWLTYDCHKYDTNLLVSNVSIKSVQNQINICVNG